MQYYIHIPFCRARCWYCRFALTTKWDKAAFFAYTHALQKEIRAFSEQHPHKPARTLYFGGGTPSLLPDELLATLIREIQDTVGIDPLAEITLEANPEDITPEKLQFFAHMGINRLSLGVQSFEPKTHAEVRRAFVDPYLLAEMLVRGPIRNINFDFIVGLPHEARGNLTSHLRTFLQKFPHLLQHISIYHLEKEVYPKHWKSCSLSDEHLTQEYREIAHMLAEFWMHRYEISNFAKKGYESRHNQGYWTQRDYKGFGLSAESFLNNVRSGNALTFADYFAGRQAYQETLSEEQKRLERILCGLRTFSVDIRDIGDRDGLQKALHSGWVRQEGAVIIPTDTGISVLDAVARLLA